MIAGWAVVLVALAYLTALFAVAHYGDQSGRRLFRGPARGTIYALAIGVYCTSWTFYGSVGLASRQGLNFLGVYVGPILVFTLGAGLLRRVVTLAKAQNSTSIADFIGARYGKSERVAAIVCLLVVIGTVPYIALQLKAISSSLATILEAIDGRSYNNAPFVFGDLALFTALLLAFFTILFGTRHIDATEHQDGLVIAIAAESIVKLLAFVTDLEEYRAAQKAIGEGWRARLGKQAALRITQPRHRRDDFREAGDRQTAVVLDDAAAGAGKLRTRKASDIQIGNQSAQFARESAGVHVAGGLAARQQEAKTQGLGRVNSDGLSGPPTFRSVTVRSSAGWPPTRTLAAKVNCTPSTAR